MDINSNPLPVQAAHQLPAREADQRWLVSELWLEEAVGLIGGEPKCCKSFLALDLAVAVASGTPALCDPRFAVPRAGRVLLYAAEDALHIVRRRLEGICAARGLALAQIDLDVITVPTLRLDLRSDCERLTRTVQTRQPRLLILDPFVRLHRIDENASGEVAPLLAYLRELQRRYALSVIVVHHAKKGGGKIRAGQALRGSSEFHAWGDSNLYLRRTDRDLTLTSEHRAAPSAAPIALELIEHDEALALEVRTGAPVPPAAAPRPADERIKQALVDAGGPLGIAELRERCRIRNATLHERLRALLRAGLLVREADGYLLAQAQA